MQRHTCRSAVLVLALLVAGCSATDDGGDTGPVSVTPASVPATDSFESTDSPTLGITNAGIADHDALAAAHRSVLENRSYTVRAVVNATYPNGSAYYRSATTTRVGKRNERYRSISRYSRSEAFDSDVVRSESWSNAHIVLAAATTTDRTTTYEGLLAVYERRTDSYGPPQYGERIVAQTVAARTSVRNRTRTIGSPGYLVSLHEPADPVVFAGTRFGDTDNVSGSILIDPRGLVREYRLEYLSTTPNGTVLSITESITYFGFGTTTVERPSWYDEAIDSTGLGNVTTTAPNA